MAVRVSCPNCQAVASVEEQSLGRRGKCRQCKHVFALARPDGHPASALSGDASAWKGSRPASPANLPEQFGRYRILKPLGQGGMGAVYLAHDTKLDRRVALKVPFFHPADGPQAVARFEREARAAATLDHPNLCPIFDVGEVDGTPYLTMPYIEGKPLSEAIPRGQQLPEAQAVDLVRKLALALAEAHERGVVHRDLKPGNIMVNRRGAPIIMDFGLARMVGGEDAPLTRTGHVLGTALYMAPEQAAGDITAAGPACDVYSLGVILYELLAGCRPFEGPWSVVIGLKSVMDPEPPSRHRHSLAPEMDAICLKSISRNQEGRYPAMSAFAEALEGYLALSQNPTPVSPPPERPMSGNPESLAIQIFAGLSSHEITSLRGEASRAKPNPAIPMDNSSRPAIPPWVAALGVAAFLLLGVGAYVLTRESYQRTGDDTPGGINGSPLTKRSEAGDHERPNTPPGGDRQAVKEARMPVVDTKTDRQPAEPIQDPKTTSRVWKKEVGGSLEFLGNGIWREHIDNANYWFDFQEVERKGAYVLMVDHRRNEPLGMWIRIEKDRWYLKGPSTGNEWAMRGKGAWE